MKHTRNKLLSSIATLIICCAMLIGSTYAWFTDSASTGVNTIKSGNLDIVLEYYDGSSWAEVNTSTKLFDDSALWEPGHTEVAYLHIKNAGSLDLKYKMNVNIPSETGSINQKDQAFKLSDYLVFGKVSMDSSTDFFSDRDEAHSEAGTTMGLSSWTKAGNLYADPIPSTAPAGSVSEEYLALVIYMPETVGNVANHKTGTAAPTIQLGVNIVATQLNSESDSFGDDYDANADGTPDNGAAWTMAAFRAVADVPATISTTGMTVTKYENDVVSDANKLAEVVIPAATATYAGLTTDDKVSLSVVPAIVPVGVTVGTDEVALNYDVKLMKVSSDNTETPIASAGNPVTVKLKVGPGLSGVRIFHTSGGTTNEVSGVTYDSTTGIAQFNTTSFSDYTVIYNAKLTATLPDNAKVVMNLDELEQAVGNLHNGDYIAFGTNIVQDKVDTTSGQITFAKASEETGAVTATLDLNGYVFDGQIGGYSFANDDLTMIIHGTDKATANYYEHETGHHMVKACALFLYSGAYEIKDGLFNSNNIVMMAYGGNTVIDGGTFEQEVNGVCIYACNDPIITINNAEMSCGEDGAIFLIEPYRTNIGPVITINDGIYDATKAAVVFVVDEDDSDDSEIAQFHVKGGTFTLGDTTDLFQGTKKSRLEITGGTFNVDPSEYVPEGYTASENNGIWTVTKN